jgi:hypothetical protein
VSRNTSEPELAMSPMEFAQALVASLGTVLPPGFAARAEGHVIRLEAPDGLGASTSIGYLDPQEATAEDYADAAWNVLSMAQDVVSETIADPWPAGMGSGTDLPEPGTRVEGQTVHLYFGAEEDPVLILAALRLDR